jgi:hypothetical protein
MTARGRVLLSRLGTPRPALRPGPFRATTPLTSTGTNDCHRSGSALTSVSRDRHPPPSKRGFHNARSIINIRTPPRTLAEQESGTNRGEATGNGDALVGEDPRSVWGCGAGRRFASHGLSQSPNRGAQKAGIGSPGRPRLSVARLRPVTRSYHWPSFRSGVASDRTDGGRRRSSAVLPRSGARPNHRSRPRRRRHGGLGESPSHGAGAAPRRHHGSRGSAECRLRGAGRMLTAPDRPEMLSELIEEPLEEIRCRSQS